MFSLLTILTIAQAKEVPVASVIASSYKAAEGSNKFDAKLLFDNKSTTSWVEDDEGSGMGSWFEVSLKESTSINSMNLWNGNWYSFNEWDFYNRGARIDVFFEDGEKESFDLSDKKGVEEIKFAKAHEGKTIKIKFAKVYAGTTYADSLAVSEIKFFDSSSESFALAEVSASSTLPEDNDGSYFAQNLQDGLKDTIWCEGQSGDGSGEKLVYDFGGSKTLSSIDLVNGNGTDFKMFMGYGSVKTVEVAFDNGSTQTLSFKPSFMPQTLKLDPVSTSKATIVLKDVKSGAKVHDTCLSELRFN
jgi:hypothetical protein